MEHEPVEYEPIERDLSFSAGDLERFAAASGDRNPLHLDPDFARRTPFGACIVHGALVAIGMLGSVPPEVLAAVRSLRLRLNGPVLPGASCHLRAAPSRRGAGAWEVTLTGRGKLLSRVITSPQPHAGPRPPVERAAIAQRALGGASLRAMLLAPAELVAAELPAGYLIEGAYSAGAELLGLASDFHAERLHTSLIEGLAWASYVVGMEVPGLHSLFASLELSVVPDSRLNARSRLQSIALREHDPRTGQIMLDGQLLEADGTAVSSATITSFARTPVTAPLPLSAPAARGSGALGEAVALIGGSRGFGATIALALLSRGLSVHVAYSSGEESAHQLTRLAGDQAERLHLHKVDARSSTALAPMLRALTEGGVELAGLVLNAAPPPLAMGVTAESAEDLVEYVAESLRLTAVPLGALLPLLTAKRPWLVFCSSSAIVSPPRDWPHYVSAKGAVEALAGWVAARLPNTRTIVLRPPMMRTELTNTPSGRIGSVPPELIAAWLVERIAGDELAGGLTVLEPDGPEIASQ
jgi:NAD(P)-dependent dehydrogenase (short-subunit alcohol dehydrogenase family)/acyl dehydratase